jgi:glycosyltransferase involved in cell wall biosynthesis
MTAPIRVFHLIKSLGRGGAEMLLPEGLRFADRARFAYGYGYFLPWKDAMVASLEGQGVEVTCLAARSNPAILLSARRVAEHLGEWKADLLHCHMPMAGAVGRLAGALAGIPVVYTEHNKMERFHPLTRWLNLRTWRWQQQVIAVSGDVADSIRSHAGSDVPVKVVLNGINVDHFRRDLAEAQPVRSRFGIPANVPVIGTVAVFRVQKRLHDWLDAARRLRAQHPTARFLIVGDGPLREELLALTIQMELDDVVHFAGLQEDVRPYLAAMDIYMMSSMFEGLPVALLEAMAMECAVVCTSVGGIPEAIRNDDNGFLVKAGDPARLARVAGEVLGSRDTMRRVGAAARRTVEQRFSMQRMTGELEATYLEVLGRYRNVG